MGIRSPQQTLDSYYALRDDLISGKVASYTLGDRTFTLQDLPQIETIIQHYESAVVAGVRVFADLSFPTNVPPFPNG